MDRRDRGVSARGRVRRRCGRKVVDGGVLGVACGGDSARITGHRRYECCGAGDPCWSRHRWSALVRAWVNGTRCRRGGRRGVGFYADLSTHGSTPRDITVSWYNLSGTGRRRYSSPVDAPMLEEARLVRLLPAREAGRSASVSALEGFPITHRLAHRRAGETSGGAGSCDRALSLTPPLPYGEVSTKRLVRSRETRVPLHGRLPRTSPIPSPMLEGIGEGTTPSNSISPLGPWELGTPESPLCPCRGSREPHNPPPPGRG